MVTKRRRLCKTGVIREAGGLNFLSTTCNFFTLGKRCVSVIDVSSCYLQPDIEDSPVSGSAGEKEVFRFKIFFDIISFFSPHGIILACGLR